jgi:hypothetical protein
LALCVILFGCTTRSTDSGAAAKSKTATAVDSISLDSCVRLDRSASRQSIGLESGDTLPERHPGSWSVTRRVESHLFDIDIPAASQSKPVDPDGIEISSLPLCRFFCDLTVSFSADSTSLDAYVARMRIVDTTDNPDAADWIPGPPRELTIHGQRALYMDRPCGDCTSGYVMLWRKGAVATLEYSIDDREGDQPGLVCRLLRVAYTFRWRDA